MNTTKIIFIGCCPRSGSTLLKRILDSDDRIYCGPEFGYLPEICRLYIFMKHRVLTGQHHNFYTEKALKESFRHFIASFIVHIVQKYNVTVFAEKTPDNLFYFTTLHELFPEAFLIHAIRHPLDVVMSFAKLNKKQGKPINLHTYKMTAEKWVKYAQAIAKPWELGKQYLMIHYEDIVKEPIRTISRLYQQIRIPFDKATISLTRSKGDPLFFHGITYTEEEYYSDIHQRSLRQWHGIMNQNEIHAIMKIVTPTLQLPGYRRYMKC